ncbi:MAG: ArnT family glycosyltransferase [Lysobacterales bacterium]
MISPATAQPQATAEGLFEERTHLPAFGFKVGVGMLLTLSLARLALSNHLPLFGDEAFYWLEGRYPAWAYSDLPPLTAWLTRLGTEGTGQHYFGVRLVFFFASLVLPVAVAALAKTLGASRNDACWAGVLSLALPVNGVIAPFALPDGPLNLLWLVAATLAARIVRGNPPLRDWVLLGLVLAAGLLTHYRFAPFLLGLAGLFIGHPLARRYLSQLGPWVCALIALSALWPQWAFNATQEFAALEFQFVDRHPWQPRLSGLRLPLVDMVLLTPVVGWLMWILVRRLAWFRRRSEAAVLLWLGLFPVLIYWGFSPLVDTERVSFHWTLAGWLTLCAGLPAALRVAAGRFKRPVGGWLIVGALVPGLLLSSSLLAYWQSAANKPQQRLPSADAVPENLLGWPQIADRVAAVAAERGTQTIIADNFMLAAQLSFELAQPVASLDHPLNYKHGRARQLNIWGQVSSSALGANDLLAVELSALSLKPRIEWMQRVCQQLGHSKIVDEIRLFGGRKRVLLMAADPAVGSPGGCDQPAFWYLDEPSANAVVHGQLTVRGWVLEAYRGVSEVELLLGGRSAGMATYGLARPGVAEFFGLSAVPDHPNTGFELTVDVSDFPPGRYPLLLRIRERDGRLRLSDPRWIELASGDSER